MLSFIRGGTPDRSVRSNVTVAQRAFLRSANQARDERNWREAAGLYRKYLNEVRDDAPIWTQYGHALKESGNMLEAEAAYRTGLAFAPQDAELYLQLGHVLKLQGRLLEAERAYLRSSALDATLGGETEISWREHMAAPPPPASTTDVAPIEPVPEAPHDPERYRHLGNRARDAGNRDEAAKHYRAYLDNNPDHGDIWVQYGHVLRDQGLLAEGERAYRTAIWINARDADALFQLGHILWMQGRQSLAFEAFGQSMEINATRVSVTGMRAVGYRIDYDDIRISASQQGLTYLEISDLIATMREYNTISGIQRVQLGLIKFILSQNLNCVISYWESGLLWGIDADSLQQTLDLYNAPIGMVQRRAMVDKMLTVSQPVRPGPDDVFIVTGAIWMRPDAAADHENVKRTGARLGAYIYDFIPLTHPEFCHPYLTERFSNTISPLMFQLDFAFSISDFVAHEFIRLREQAGYPAIPIETIPLAHMLDAATESEPVWTGPIAALRDKPFVLCVGSLAAHKNHIFALQVWRLLIERRIDPPILVLAGKVGYGVEDLMIQLKATRYLNGRVKVIEGLNDAALSTLYQSCLFTLFPSFVEGWGLPVGESLAHGKVCVASNTSSIPEVGGEFTPTIDPYNARAAADLIAKLITDRRELRRLEKRIADDFKPRSWDDFGNAFWAAITRASSLPSSGLMRLKPLEMLQLRPAPTNWPYGPTLPDFAEFKVKALSMTALISGWFPGEDWGRWMDGDRASISLTTSCPPGLLVRIVMQCRSVFWPRRNHLTVTAVGGETTTTPVPVGHQDFVVHLDCTVGRSGRLDIQLALSGVVSNIEGEPRRLGVGLRKLVYLVLDPQVERVPSGVLIQPTALLGRAGGEAPAYSRDALIEAARRQTILAEGWLRPEAWGTWMSGREAQLRFHADAAEHERLRVVLRLRSSTVHGGSISAQVEGGLPSITVLPPGEVQDGMVSVVGQAGAGGMVSITLRVNAPDARVGLSTVVWGNPQDAADRQALLESVLFGPSERQVNDAELLSRNTSFTVTGHITGTYSLASVNRRLALALDDALPGQVRVVQVEGQPTDDLEGLAEQDYARLSVLAQRKSTGQGPQVVISQHWPVWRPQPPYDVALAYIFWEESVVPREMIDTLNTGFRGVLVPARSVGKALIDSGLRIPVRFIGFAPQLAAFEAIAESRFESIPNAVARQRSFTFLHVSSCFPRKGVDVLIAAYAKAFTSRDPVRLVIKGFPNPHNDVAEQLARLREVHADLAEIELIDMDLSEDALLDLYRTADCVVLPTRGEGFNIPAAEALAAGLPLIVTAFGGQADFTKGVARLVDYRFTHSRSHLRTSASVWAEPDVDDLCSALQEAVRGSGAPAASTVRTRGRERARQLADGTLWADRVRAVAAELLTTTAVPRSSIAWVSTWKIRCGIAEYSRMLLDAFPAEAHDMTVLCDSRTDDADLSGVGVSVRKAWRRVDGSSMGALIRAIQQTNASTVVVQYHHALIRWEDLATLLENEHVRTRRIVVTMHNTKELLDADPMVQQRLVAALAGVSRVLVHAVADLNLLKRQGLVENVAMFPHGALTNGLPVHATRTLAHDQDVKLGTYGFFLPHKGFDRLIEAFAVVRRTYFHATLTLVTAEYPTPESASEIARCRALAVSLGVADAINWHLDYLPNEESLALLNGCDLLILPYQNTAESSSAAVRSALAAHVPVLVTPLPIFEELQHAVLRLTGIDVAAIAGGIEWVVKHQDARRQLVEASNAWLAENSWASVAERFSGLLQGLAVSEEA